MDVIAYFIQEFNKAIEWYPWRIEGDHPKWSRTFPSCVSKITLDNQVIYVR